MLTSLLSSVIRAGISLSNTIILRVRKTWQLFLWARVNIPCKLSKLIFEARLRALNLSRPQYTAFAPAKIAAFIESTSPPGASNSIFLFTVLNINYDMCCLQ